MTDQLPSDQLSAQVAEFFRAGAMPSHIKTSGEALRVTLALRRLMGDEEEPFSLFEHVRIFEDRVYGNAVLALVALEKLGATVELEWIERTHFAGIVTAWPHPASMEKSKKQTLTGDVPHVVGVSSLWCANREMAARATLAIQWLWEHHPARVAGIVLGPDLPPFTYGAGAVVGRAEQATVGKDGPEASAPLPGDVNRELAPGEALEPAAPNLPRRLAHARALDVDKDGIAAVLNRLLGGVEVSSLILNVTVRRRPKHPSLFWLKVSDLALFRYVGTGYVLEGRWSLEQWEAACNELDRVAPPPVGDATAAQVIEEPTKQPPPTQEQFEAEAEAAAALEHAEELEDDRAGQEPAKVIEFDTFAGSNFYQASGGAADGRKIAYVRERKAWRILDRDSILPGPDQCAPLGDIADRHECRDWLDHRMRNAGCSASMIEETRRQTLTMTGTEIVDLAETFAPKEPAPVPNA